MSLTADELTIVLQRLSPETRTLIAERASSADPFAEPVEIATVKAVPNNAGVDGPVISPDGLKLVFTATLANAQQLWLLERGKRTEPFGAPKRALTELNKGVLNAAGSFSRDGRRLYFSSSREFAPNEGSFQNNNIFVADDFGSPTALLDDETGKTLVGVNPAVSADGGTLYFSRLTTTGFRIYVAELVDGRAKKIELVDLPSDTAGGPNQVMGSISGDHCGLYFAATTTTPNFDLFLARRR